MSKYKRGSLTLARQVFNTPQLILADDLQNIAQYLVNRANGVELEQTKQDKDLVKQPSLEQLASYSNDDEKQRYHKRLGITNDGKRANLEIVGTLVAKAGEIDADCMELTSYEKLFNTFQLQVKEGVEELVLHVDSGGGSAFSCFEMAQEVKSLAVANNIKIYAFVDGLSASAAYAWTSIADEIVARKNSEIGSVGVVVQLVNNSKMLENIGLTRTFIYNGSQKVPFQADGDFSPQFLASTQKKVDKTGLDFHTFISKNRNMSVEDVIATQAEVFDTADALRVGFIDKVMTKAEFFNDYLPKQSQNNTSYFMNNTIPYEENMTELEKLQAQLATMQTTLTASETSLTEKTTELSDLLATKESLDTTVADLQKQLTDSQASVTKLTEQLDGIQKDAVTADRKAKLEATLGKDNEQVPQLLASTASLDEQAFSAIVSAMSTKVEKEEKSMTEVGNSANDNAPAPTYQDRLKAKAQAR